MSRPKSAASEWSFKTVCYYRTARFSTTSLSRFVKPRAVGIGERSLARGSKEWVRRHWLERRPGSLSGGQRQRVALARGLAGDPALVLLDEPLSALDSPVRRELRDLIRQVLVSSGIPAVLVTHDADEAEELGDDVIAYDAGRVKGQRTIERPEEADTPRTAPESESR